MSIDDGSNSILSTSNSNAFGLSKDLKVPISLRLCYLQPANSEAITKQLARPSEKYSNPSVFRKLSKVYFNSDLFVKVEVMNGSSHSPVTVYTHSLYHSFSNNKRAWNKVLELPINYNQLGIDSYMKITIFELSNTTPVVFGKGTLSLFNTKLSTLRRGLQKVAIVTNPIDSDTTENMNYGEMDDLTDMELKSIKYENGEISKAEWLDRISLPIVEKLRDQQIKISNKDNDDGLFYLYMELPNFELPIVFSDITYNLPEAKEITTSFIDNRNTKHIVECKYAPTVDYHPDHKPHNKVSIGESKNYKRASIFPDGWQYKKGAVVSERAIKHLNALIKGVSDGDRCYNFYFSLRDYVEYFRPNYEKDLIFNYPIKLLLLDLKN